MCRSEPQIPARVSRIRIAPGSTSGTGYSRSSNSPPYAFNTAMRPFMGLGRRSGQNGARSGEGFPCHVLGRTGPRLGIRRLVAERARVSLGGNRAEELLERHAAVARGETVERLARLEA